MSALASKGTGIRPMRPDDWLSVPIEPWKYSNPGPLTGFQPRDRQAGNPLHPVLGEDRFEKALVARLQRFRRSYQSVIAERLYVHMPHWNQDPLPRTSDYTLVNAPERLTTTSLTIAMVPNEPACSAEMGFYFKHRTLPTLRARMEGSLFRGLVGNLGYFMTDALIHGATWSHNLRFPQFPLPKVPAYIGFHLFRKREETETYGSFQGAHPAAVGIHKDGSVDIVPNLSIARYQVLFGGPSGISVEVEAINPRSFSASVMLFTPAFQGTTEIRQLIEAAEASAGTDDGWQQCKPMVPAFDRHDRVSVFIANEGNGHLPVEKVVAVWDGPAPLPSFGGLLSFDRAHFDSLFGSVGQFQREFVGSGVQVIPHGTEPGLDDYVHIMGGFVPAIVDHAHIYYDAPTTQQVMKALTCYGATSPIAQCGRETKNFDLQVREPAGVLLQTENHIGWALFDGRHEMSIGASIVDVAAILKKLEALGIFEGRVRHAFFVDGGSAMKAYHVIPGQPSLSLDLLNRVAAGSRNGPGADADGLNLYTLLKLNLDPMD